MNNVDLIFLDIKIPVTSGFDFLDGLKKLNHKLSLSLKKLNMP